jgi:hypothetical protein
LSIEDGTLLGNQDRAKSLHNHSFRAKPVELTILVVASEVHRQLMLEVGTEFGS